MKESDYTRVCDLARLRVINSILLEILPDWASKEGREKFNVARQKLFEVTQEAYKLNKADLEEEDGTQ